MITPEVVRQINKNKTVIKYGKDYILISTALPSESGGIRYPETLAFLCSEEGEVHNWSEVAGGPHMSFVDVVNEIICHGIRR